MVYHNDLDQRILMKSMAFSAVFVLYLRLLCLLIGAECLYTELRAT